MSPKEENIPAWSMLTLQHQSTHNVLESGSSITSRGFSFQPGGTLNIFGNESFKVDNPHGTARFYDQDMDEPSIGWRFEMVGELEFFLITETEGNTNATTTYTAGS